MDHYTGHTNDDHTLCQYDINIINVKDADSVHNNNIPQRKNIQGDTQRKREIERGGVGKVYLVGVVWVAFLDKNNIATKLQRAIKR